MVRMRRSETAEQRAERLKKNQEQQETSRRHEEEALDDRIRKNIELHGP